MGLGQYNSLGKYCDPHTACSVFLILVSMWLNEIKNKKEDGDITPFATPPPNHTVMLAFPLHTFQAVVTIRCMYIGNIDIIQHSEINSFR